MFGSGGARRVPEGFPKEDAFEQFVEFGKRIAPEARAHGLTIAIEPLCRDETNRPDRSPSCAAPSSDNLIVLDRPSSSKPQRERTRQAPTASSGLYQPFE